MSKNKKGKSKDISFNKTVIIITLFIAFYTAVTPHYYSHKEANYKESEIAEKNTKIEQLKPIVYTAVQIIGKEEKPKDENIPNRIKVQVTVTNNGGSPIQLDSSINIYVVNNKTNKQIDLPAKLIKLSNKNQIISRNPILLEPNDSFVYDTSFFEFDYLFSFHNQYVVHLYSRDNDLVSTIKPFNFEKAEKLSSVLTTMNGIMKHNFGSIAMPKSEAKEIQKLIASN